MGFRPVFNNSYRYPRPGLSQWPWLHSARFAPNLCHERIEKLQAEYPEFQPPKYGNLTAWASNGVLMLNTCLTLWGWGANLPSRAYDQTGSDKSGVGRGIVFLAWGNWAAKCRPAG
ncbi:hypothetical protein BDN71DRAFT_1434415 [Pleurotus eryngii]|uniref:Uncharacterized protein n=1 Tax=Pleurotus eryngii TaxID=5323 RepID=A0A9P5ZNS6_PLEER|nr:hypothetical protein BDN71DRAFT_1434415 [Pleurotus eryngii]